MKGHMTPQRAERVLLGAPSLEVVVAPTLAVASLAVLRARGGLGLVTQSRAGEGSLRCGVLHPIALAMIVGNAAILGVSLAQL